VADTVPGNTSTTQTLNIGASASSAIDLAGDADWWRVSLLQGWGYRIWVEGAGTGHGSLLDPYLGFYSGTGTLLLSNNDRAPGVLDSYLYATATAGSGTYFLSAEEFGHNATGTYTITIERDVLDNATTAASVAVNGSLSTSIDWNGDRDWVAVSLIAGTTYQFDLVGAESDGALAGFTVLDPWLGLMNSAGATVRSDNDSGLGLNSRINFTPSTSGTYYLSLEESGADATGSLKVLVNSAPVSGSLALGNVVNAAVDVAGDVDLYSVALTAGTTYYFELKGNTLADPFLELLNSSFSTNYSNDDSGAGTGSALTFTPSASGTYYLLARDNGHDSTGSYTLSARTATAVPMAASGTATTGQIASSGETDWFSVALTQGVRYMFAMKGADTGDGTLGDPQLRLFAQSGVELASDSDSGLGDNALLSFTPSTSGTYLLAANGFSTGTGTYTIRALPNDASPDRGAPVFSGSSSIDATIHGYAWELGASRTLTWAIADSGDWNWTNASGSADQIAEVLASVAAVANLKFEYAGYYTGSGGIAAAASAGVDITIAFDSDFFSSAGIWGRANFPSVSSIYNPYPGAAGDVLLNPLSDANGLSYEPGSAGYFLVLHELGHALGLKHPHDDGGTGHPTFAQAGIPADLNKDWSTVMSYEDQFSWNLKEWDPSTPMMFDVKALQYLYGPNTTTFAGNTTHDLLVNARYQTIWDAGGYDKVDASHSIFGWNIFLSLGSTDVGLAMRADEEVLVRPTTLYWLMGGLEEVLGSNQADQIHGNAGANVLRGNDGNDSLEGGPGNDTLYGGAGDDTFDWDVGNEFLEAVRVGNDVMHGGPGNDAYVIYGLDQVVELAGEGVDLVWVQSTFSLATLPYVENISAYGSASLNLTGNESSFGNVLRGNGAINTLDGQAGPDTLYGGAGNDTLIGGAGIDVFLYDSATSDKDTINDFTLDDIIRIQGASFSSASFVPAAAGQGLNTIHVASSGGVTTLSIGTNSTAGTDLVILLRGTFASSALVASGSDIRLASGQNSAPTASHGTAVTAEDTPLSGVLPVARDANGDPISYSKATNPGRGTVSVSAYGNYTYTPAANFNGTDSFTFTVSDSSGASNTYTQTLTVTAVNDAPTSQAGQASTSENVVLNGRLPAASDADGDALTYARATAPRNGTVVVGADGSYAYTPRAGSTGVDTFDFSVSDGKGGINSYTMTITVNALARQLTGTANNDSLVGGAQADVIDGLGGNDTLRGGEGSDTLRGGSGDDVLHGEGGLDRHEGGAGNDTVVLEFDRGDYVLSRHPQTGQVEILIKAGGTEPALEVEVFQFRDTTINTSALGYLGQYSAEPPGAVASVYRFFNTRDSAFFYTSSAGERDMVIANSNVAKNNVGEWPYVYQGTSFEAAHSYAGGTAVYRFFNTRTGHHFFTASEGEADVVKANSASGAWPYVFEGNAFSVYAQDPTPGSVGQEAAVHRFYSATLDRHFYTADAAEVAAMKLTGVWTYEGVAFYGELPGG